MEEKGADDDVCVPPPEDEELIAMLERVQLEYLVDRVGGLDVITDWSSVLSLGEQQRLSFARLLLAQPELALLDESTSALDAANEAILYSELSHDNITFISVGHRPALLKYHKNALLLQGKVKDTNGAAPGSWKVVPAEDALAGLPSINKQGVA